MSIAATRQLSDELRRLSIAGAVLANGDHRIAKLIPTLEQSGAKVPVFSKIAKAAQSLVDAERRSAAIALLRANALVQAVLKTQGKSSIDGDLAPLDEASLQGNKPISSRILEDVKAALSSGYEGRMSTIHDAIERGYFGDIRLAEAAVQALRDNNHEVAGLAAGKLIPPYGPGIAPLLTAQFDPTEKKPGARVLDALRACDPEEAARLARLVLSESPGDRAQLGLAEGGEPSIEVRAAALECLSKSDADLGVLLDQLTARNKALRTSAHRTLLAHRHPDAEDLLLEKLRGSNTKLREAIESLPSINSPEVLEVVDGVLEDLFIRLKKKEVKPADLNTLMLLLHAIASSDLDSTTLALVHRTLDMLAPLDRQASSQSYNARQNLDRLKREIVRFLLKAGPGQAPVLAKSIRHLGSEQVIPGVLQLVGPAEGWTLLKGHLKKADRTVEHLFCQYYSYLYRDVFEIPPAAEWPVNWLKYAVKHKMESAIAYLHELDPKYARKELLKVKVIKGSDLAALILALAPDKSVEIASRLKTNYGYFRGPFNTLAKNMAANDSVLVALDEVAPLVSDHRIREMLERNVATFAS